MVPYDLQDNDPIWGTNFGKRLVGCAFSETLSIPFFPLKYGLKKMFTYLSSYGSVDGLLQILC